MPADLVFVLIRLLTRGPLPGLLGPHGSWKPLGPNDDCGYPVIVIDRLPFGNVWVLNLPTALRIMP